MFFFGSTVFFFCPIYTARFLLAVSCASLSVEWKWASRDRSALSCITLMGTAHWFGCNFSSCESPARVDQVVVGELDEGHGNSTPPTQPDPS